MNELPRSVRVGATLLCVLAGLTAAPFTATPAAAQDSGFSFVAGLAYEDGGPGPELVEALRHIELDDVRPGGCRGTVCVEPTAHPFYFDEGLDLAVLLGFRYRFRAPLSVEGLISNGARGHAEGYDAEARDHLVVSYASFLLTTTLGAHLGPVRVEAGPVFNSTRWKSTFNSTRETKDGTFTVGGLVGASASFRFKEVLISLRTGVRRFPSAGIENPLQVQLEAGYDSFYVGASVANQIL